MSSNLNIRHKPRLGLLGLLAVLCLFITSLSPATAAMVAAGNNSPNSAQTPTGTGTTGANMPGHNLAEMRCDGPATNLLTGPNEVGRRMYNCISDELKFGLGFAPPLGSLKNTVAIAQKKVGADGKVTATFVPSGFKSWKERYEWGIRAAFAAVTNFIDETGEKGALLTRSGKNADVNSDPSLVGESEKAATRTFNSSGGVRDAYSLVFSKNAEAIGAGACQMIALPQGINYKTFPFTPLHDGTNQVQGMQQTSKIQLASMKTIDDDAIEASVANKQPRGQQLNGNAEAILDPKHPFSPRHYTNWKDRTSPSMVWAMWANEYPADMSSMGSPSNAAGQASGMGEAIKYSYTWVCGHKGLPNAYTFTKVMPWGGRTNAWTGGYDYYSKPMGKGGLILVNDGSESHKRSPDEDKDRDGKFSSKIQSKVIEYYAQCVPICISVLSVYATSYCQEYCKKVAVESSEHELCREIILPPVTPINHLKMAYNQAPEGKMGGMTSTPGSNLPYIYTENRAGFPNHYDPTSDKSSMGIKDESLSWYFANPWQQFGYNMPPLKNWSTGLPASKAVLSAAGATIYKPDITGGTTPDTALAKLTPWRLAIVGVNKYYMPDESNDSSVEAHNMSAQYGAWNELVLYQARCGSWRGLNCLCDYKTNFYKGSGMAAAMKSAGISIAITEPKMRNKTIAASAQNGQDNAREPFGVVATDLGQRFTVSHDTPINKGGPNGYRFWPMLFQPMESGKLWPGKLEGYNENDLIGLDKSEAGNIVYTNGLSTDSKSIKAKMPMVAYVRRVRDDGCREVTIQNDDGTVFDAAGNSETWGDESFKLICPPSQGQTASTGTQNKTTTTDDPIKITDETLIDNKNPECANAGYAKCIDPDFYSRDKNKGWGVYPVNGKKQPDGTYKNYDNRKFCAAGNLC